MLYFIAYDLGTGGIKASLFDERGASLADAFLQYETLFPREKYCEQRPMDWWNGVCLTTKELLKRSGVPKDRISSVALSGHSLVAVPLSSEGELLMEQVPIWCDMRAVEQAEEFFQRVSYDSWYRTTGNGDPAECYTIMKLMWLKQHHPELFQRIHKIVGSKDFINYKLTGSVCTDPSYASGFGVFDLSDWNYKDLYFEAAGIDRCIFPDIVPSDKIIGTITAKAANESGLPEGIPVACGAVDNTCMALGTTGLEEGSVYTSLGSSSWIAVTSKQPILDTLTKPFVFAHARKGYYTSAVSIFSAGNSFRWVRDQLCRDLDSDVNTYELMNRMAACVPVGSNGVLFNPTLAGGSAQEPSPNLCGGFMGLTLRNTREDMVRASMEGIAMALRKALDILSGQVELSCDMLICGGGSKSEIWRSIFASVYNKTIIKTNIDQNAASLGAAALAANACGIWNGYDLIRDIHKVESMISPDAEAVSIYDKLLGIYEEWTLALAGLGDSMASLKL